MIMKNINFEVAAREAMKNAEIEVKLFCQIMEMSEDDVFFVAGDPHGVVAIGDYFFNMSEIHEVIVHYEKHIKNYGSNEELSNAIIRWYDWCMDWHHRFPSGWQFIDIDVPKEEMYCLVGWEDDFGVPEIEHASYLPKEKCFEIFDKNGKIYRDYIWKDGRKVQKWLFVPFFTERDQKNNHYINLQSWLKGADALVEERKRS